METGKEERKNEEVFPHNYSLDQGKVGELKRGGPRERMANTVSTLGGGTGERPKEPYRKNVLRH